MLDFVGYGRSFLSYTMENPIQDLIFYFIFYSFIGWIIEGLYSLFTTGVFFKKNFLRGPFKPMYGFAPIILLECINPNASIGFIMFLSFIIPSVVELISGFLLKGVFGELWWDYSEMKCNIGGHICLKFSIYWIGLCALLIYIVHPVIHLAYKEIYTLWSSVYVFALIYLACDFTYTVISRRKAYKKLAFVRRQYT